MTDAKLDLVQRIDRPGLMEKIAAASAHVSRQALEKVAVPAAAQTKEVIAFLDESLNAAPGKPHAYEYRSNDIIATLKGPLKTFKTNKYDLDTKEATTRGEYELQKQAREN